MFERKPGRYYLLLIVSQLVMASVAVAAPAPLPDHKNRICKEFQISFECKNLLSGEIEWLDEDYCAAAREKKEIGKEVAEDQCPPPNFEVGQSYIKGPVGRCDCPPDEPPITDGPTVETSPAKVSAF